MTEERKSSIAGVVTIDYIEDGDTLNNFLRDFEGVKREQAIRFLGLAKEQLLECVSS